jgi:hypothetical protein
MARKCCWTALPPTRRGSHTAVAMKSVVVDPTLPSPNDIVRMEDAPFFAQPHYLVQPRSMVILGAMHDERF